MTDGVTLGRDFRSFVVARTVAWFGSAVALVAFPLVVYSETRSASATALLAAVESVPYLVFGLFAGAVADRWRRRPTMVVTALVSGVAVASVPIASAVGSLTLAHVFGAAFISAAAAVFFDAAGFGLLPALVPRRMLADAVARATAVATAVTMVGPAVGGILIALSSPATVLGLNAATFAVAAAIVGVVREPARHGEIERRSFRRETAEGLVFIRDHRLVRLLTLIGTGNSIAGGVVSGLLVVTAVERYRVSADGGWIGAFFTALGVGTLIATMLLPRLSRNVAPGEIAVGGLAVQFAAIGIWSLSHHPVIGLGALVVYQAAASTVIVNGITVRHMAAPEHLQGRVNTTARMLAWGGQPVGAGLAGALVGPIGVGGALMTAAVVALATASVALLSPLREIGHTFHAGQAG